MESLSTPPADGDPPRPLARHRREPWPTIFLFGGLGILGIGVIIAALGIHGVGITLMIAGLVLFRSGLLNRGLAGT